MVEWTAFTRVFCIPFGDEGRWGVPVCMCVCVHQRFKWNCMQPSTPLPPHLPLPHSQCNSTALYSCRCQNWIMQLCSLTWKWVQWPFIYLADAERLWQNNSPSPQWWQILEAARRLGLRDLDMMHGIGCRLKCRGEESDRNRTKYCILLERNAVSFFWY